MTPQSGKYVCQFTVYHLNNKAWLSVCSWSSHAQIPFQWPYYVPGQLSMIRILPSGHMTFMQRRLNVDATSQRCIDVVATLYRRHVYIEDIYSFTVNTKNIFIECNENISIFTSAKHEWKCKCFHYTRWKCFWCSLKKSKFSFYFIVHTSMRVSEVINNVTKHNKNVMASTLSA